MKDGFMNIKDLHSKQKGTIGELAVAKYLTTMGIPVFTELGDLSRIDLVADIKFRLVKIQVKACITKNGKVDIYSYKTGPNYSFTYNKDDVDVFAIYVLDRDILFFMSVTDVLKQKVMAVRIDKPKNNQKKKINSYEDYLDFFAAIN